MSFDWFTLVAQLVNFALLLVLLRVFLYRPVLDVMDQREARLAENWEQAQRVQEEAAAQAAALASEREEFERGRRERLDRLDREVEELRERRLSELDRFTRQERQRLANALEEERDGALELLRDRTASLLTDELRVSLRDLADAELEDRVVQVFRNRLAGLDPAAKEALSKAAWEEAPVVTTAFEPDAKTRHEITATVRDLTGSALEPTFVTDGRLLFGVSLSAGGVRVAVSARDRLEALERAFEDALDSIRGVAAGQSAAPEKPA